MSRTGKVEEIEDFLGAREQAIARVLKDEVGTQLHELSPDATVTFYAHIKKKGDSDGIVPVGSYSASELYGLSDVPAVEFARQVAAVESATNELLSVTEVIEQELRFTHVLKNIGELKAFFGITPGHDELIALLILVGRGLAAEPVSFEKMSALRAGFTRLLNRVRFSDELLDQIESDFEDAGLNTDPSLIESPDG